MVGFWPFSREDASSPKSFEKRLATLSDKIQRLQIRGDTLSATHRRVKVLFTLYSFFAYLVAFLILTLVTGYQKWSTAEWTGIAGSPVAIVGFRYFVDLYFDWREENVRFRLERATKERDVVIKKLKDAMRYDSTKELLDKYGGGKRSPAKQKDGQSKNTAQKNQMPQRTGFAPPPTANIPGRIPPAQNAIDAKLRNVSASSQKVPPTPPSQYAVDDRLAPGESFAPNAYSASDRPPVGGANYSQPARPGLLDRVLDLIVGQDESAASNRIVLLCSKCRLVNGQAPPGIRSLAELGRWRCSACGAWNGMESDSGKIIDQAKADVAAEGRESPSANSVSSPTSDSFKEHLDDSDADSVTRD